MKVIVFGYSDNEDRFSNIATKLLQDYKHEVITINPRQEEEIDRIKTSYDTLTLYVNPVVGDKFADVLLKSKPKRVIFNPGTENSNLQKKFEAMGCEVVLGCTLVMLRSGTF